jgi:hypothetical protein
LLFIFEHVLTGKKRENNRTASLIYPTASVITCGMFLFQNLFDFTWQFSGIVLLFLANLAIAEADMNKFRNGITTPATCIG